jgi:hypothetical protein
MGPAFTQEQLEQIEKIHDRYADRRAELTNRLKVIMLETEEMLADDGAPDFKALERTIEETAEIRVELAKIRLEIHQEIRPLLDDDQKVLFDRGIGRLLRGGRGARDGARGMARPGMRAMGRGQAMCAPGGFGGMGGGAGGGMGGRMGGGKSGGPGMGGGPGQVGMAPWCPFADADDAEDE